MIIFNGILRPVIIKLLIAKNTSRLANRPYDLSSSSNNALQMRYNPRTKVANVIHLKPFVDSLELRALLNNILVMYSNNKVQADCITIPKILATAISFKPMKVHTRKK